MKAIISSLFSKKPSLWFCILMDAMGMLTYLLPGVGEWGDSVWAPLSAYIFYASFGSIGGVLGGIFNFIEESLPFTDLIPTFTIAWYLQKQGIIATEKKNPPTEDAEVIEIK